MFLFESDKFRSHTKVAQINVVCSLYYGVSGAKFHYNYCVDGGSLYTLCKMHALVQYQFITTQSVKYQNEYAQEFMW